jgi:transcriptional regulator with XRE-family HTH domain
MEFKDRLHQLRADRGWSQTELARRAGLTPQAINQLERGKYRPTLETLCKLKHAFGMSLDNLADPICRQVIATIPAQA